MAKPPPGDAEEGERGREKKDEGIGGKVGGRSKWEGIRREQQGTLEATSGIWLGSTQQTLTQVHSAGIRYYIHTHATHIHKHVRNCTHNIPEHPVKITPVALFIPLLERSSSAARSSLFPLK